MMTFQANENLTSKSAQTASAGSPLSAKVLTALQWEHYFSKPSYQAP